MTRYVLPALLACLLFQIAGFTYIAYPSASWAYGHYGDFQGNAALAPDDPARYADNGYADSLTAPMRSLPLLRLFHIEGKAVNLVIGDPVQTIIFLAALNRTLGLIVFFLILRALAVPPLAAIAALLIFTFQYSNIGFVQSMKFLAGWPFFLLWILGYLRYRETRGSRWLAIHAACLVPCAIAEQWTIFFIAAFYMAMPLLRHAAGRQLDALDLAGSAGVALASSVLYAVERSRLAHGLPALLSLVPTVSRSPYMLEYAAFILFALIALAAGIAICRLSRPFPGRHALSLIASFAIFQRSLIFLYPVLPTLRNADYMTFTFPYWLLVTLALWLILRRAFAAGGLDETSLLALAAWIIASLPGFLTVLGIAMPQSPVLDAIATPLLVIAALRHARIKPAVPYIIFALVIALIPLSTYKFALYADGVGRLWAMIPVILVPTLIAVFRHRHHA